MTSAVRRIGRYQVEDVLGTGAFATVYRATDERLDDTVAVKVLAENHSLSLEIRKRFLDEGKALRRIDSPHVIRVHDLGETDAQQPYLILELADRGTLSRRVDGLRNGWEPTMDDVRAVARPLAGALGAVHRADLVHRDLNPGNILLTTRGLTGDPGGAGPTSTLVGGDERLILADLGLVKDLARNSGFTSAGGTEGFRPPELRRGPARIDGRADLWSLSAVMVWLVTGTPPGDHPVHEMLGPGRLPEPLAGLTGVLGRGLAYDPADRHPDAATWLDDVEAALAPASGPAAAPADAGPPGGEPPRTVLDRSDLPPGQMPPDFARTEIGPSGQQDRAATATTYPPAAGYGTPAGVGAPPMYGQTAGYGPGPGTRGPAGAPPAVPVLRGTSWTWHLRHSLWLLATLPLGLTTWAGFLYIGIRARRSAWFVSAAIYGTALVPLLALTAFAPQDADGNPDPDAWQTGVVGGGFALLWLAGMVHGFISNFRWLRWRAGGESLGRPVTDPPAPA